MTTGTSTPTGIFGRFAHLGIRVVSMAAGGAGAGGAAPGAYGSPTPAPPREPVPGCCHLALPNTPCPSVGPPQNYYCPQGYYRQWWYCTQGTRQVACAECTKSTSTCWSGPFVCSIWWWAS